MHGRTKRVNLQKRIATELIAGARGLNLECVNLSAMEFLENDLHRNTPFVQ